MTEQRVCKRCGQVFYLRSNSPKNKLYCSITCAKAIKHDGGICRTCGKRLTRDQKYYCSPYCCLKYRYESNPYVGRTTGDTGAISELRVCVDLMVKGYEVFRAISPASSCDLLVLHDGTKILRMEVRTAPKNKMDGKLIKNKNDKDHQHHVDHFVWVSCSGIEYDPPLG